MKKKLAAFLVKLPHFWQYTVASTDGRKRVVYVTLFRRKFDLFSYI